MSNYKVYGWSNGFKVITDGTGKYGVLNKDNVEICPIKYDSVLPIDEKKRLTMPNLSLLAIVMVGTTCDAKYGIIDEQGQEVIKPICDYIDAFKFNLIKVCINGKFGLFDYFGKCICEPIYEEMRNFKSRVVIIRKNGKFGLLSDTGVEVCEPKYDFIEDFQYGLAKVHKEKKFGYIDPSGKEICSPVYDSIWLFKATITAIQDNKIIRMDKKGRIKTV